MKKLLSFLLATAMMLGIFTVAFSHKSTPSDLQNNVVEAEIVHLPLKNIIVFGSGSPTTPEGIILNLKFADGTEKEEMVIKADSGYYAGDACVEGSVHITVVRYGLQSETLYINQTVTVEYNYFVLPPVFIFIKALFNIFA